MATVTRGPSDQFVLMIRKALEAYEQQHPNARADLFRSNPGSIWVRIVDPDFEGTSEGERHRRVVHFLKERTRDDPMEPLDEVSTLLLLTPDEREDSLMNRVFDNPTYSRFGGHTSLP